MELLEQQKSAKTHLANWKVGALFMEAGTGKTRVACEIVNSVKGIDYILYIAPLRIIKPHHKETKTIKDEINKWGGFNCVADFVGIETIQSSDRTYLSILSKLEKAKKPFIVVDESLKIKNIGAKRTQRLLHLSTKAEYKLILNGTPITRNLLDMWSQMEFLSPKILDMTYNQFKDAFCCYTTITKRFNDNRKEYTKEYITGYDNVDYLYSLIRHYIYECDLSLNVTQNYNTIKYYIDDEARREYEYIKEYFLNDETLLWKNNNIFFEMTQKMQHCYCCTEDKFRALYELFNEIEQSRTIIFCKYIKSQEECSRRYPNAKVLSYQKDALGLNMQYYNNTIYFDKIWDLALRIQSSRRTYRTGQEYDCKYWDLTGDVGLEKLIDNNIDKKVKITEYFKSKTKEQLKKEL